MQKIKDYYLIGDLHSAALVSKEASIDWLCLPHFDSPSIFASILDKNAGNFSVQLDGCNVQSEYIKDTAIVRFKFQKQKKSFTIDDFMVPQPVKQCEVHFLVRKISGIKGTNQVTFLFSPREEYGKKDFKENKSLLKLLPKKVEDADNEPALILKIEEHIVILYLPKESKVEVIDNVYKIKLKISEGQKKSIIMAYANSIIDKSFFSHEDLERKTYKFWKDWISKGKFFNFCKDELIRSAITLKLMQFYPTGAIVAAPTTSLPENLGGERNWDYRYVWIRDATFTLYAFYVLGFFEEAEHFFDFIENILKKEAREDFDISLMYTIDGDPVPEEKTLDYLSGYENSKPVRVGNAASKQFQLDVYGALIDARYFATKHNLETRSLRADLIKKLLKKIVKNWKRNDSGIWEIRKMQRHYTYSKVMAWVGVNRAIRMSKELKMSGKDLRFYQDLQKEIYGWIWKNCYDPVNKTLRQFPQSIHQDATNFLFVLLQFLDKHDPLTKKIVEQTAKELSEKEIFVYRYLTNDRVRGWEGTFLLCTFWMISMLAVLEDVGKASKLFSKLQKHIAKNGLLSEEIDPQSGEYLGNFPQAFSHIGFIMSAYYINRYTNKK